MAGGNTSKRVFPADIFAEDNDKWSWSVPSANAKTPTGISNYAALRKVTKDECSSSSSSSEGESVFRSDSNSVKRSFRKRGSSSNSEGNPLEDASSSSGPIGTVPHERVLPSMYDDDARSASPSAYVKKDLAFASSFHKEFYSLPDRNHENSPFSSFEDKVNKPSKVSEKEVNRRNSKDMSPNESPRRSSKTESQRSRSRRSRSKSRDRRSARRSLSRSRPTRSPMRDRLQIRTRDHHAERDKRHCSRSKRSRSRDSRRSRSRSKESKRRSRSFSRGRKRSRSHSREFRKSRSRSRDCRRSRSHSRDYRRSRSRSYDRSRHSHYRSSSRDRYRRRRYSRSHSRSRDRSKGRSGSGNRKPVGSLPLSTSGGAMTPQMALQQTMAAMSAKAQALTGIALPKYYNPAAINPLKYAEQVQKRKLLWQSSEKVEEQPKNSVWDKLTFAQDQDGKMTAKFRKLMGIKTEGAAKEPQPEDKESVLKKQEELFRDLDQQYEMARVTTHTQRGVGLGYSAQALFPPVQK